MKKCFNYNRVFNKDPQKVRAIVVSMLALYYIKGEIKMSNEEFIEKMNSYLQRFK